VRDRRREKKMADLKKCDFCGVIIKPKQAFDYGIYDSEGIAWDKGDLCKVCKNNLDRAIEQLKKELGKHPQEPVK
jgi:hypothetical protein